MSAPKVPNPAEYAGESAEHRLDVWWDALVTGHVLHDGPSEQVQPTHSSPNGQTAQFDAVLAMHHQASALDPSADFVTRLEADLFGERSDLHESEPVESTAPMSATAVGLIAAPVRRGWGRHQLWMPGLEIAASIALILVVLAVAISASGGRGDSQAPGVAPVESVPAGVLGTPAEGTAAALTCDIEPLTDEEIQALIESGPSEPRAETTIHVSELLQGGLVSRQTEEAVLNFLREARVCAALDGTYRAFWATWSEPYLRHVLQYEHFREQWLSASPAPITPEDIADYLKQWDDAFMMFALADGRVALLSDGDLTTRQESDRTVVEILAWDADRGMFVLDDVWEVQFEPLPEMVIEETVVIALERGGQTFVEAGRDDQVRMLSEDGQLDALAADPTCFVAEMRVTGHNENWTQNIEWMAGIYLRQLYPERFVIVHDWNEALITGGYAERPAFIELTFYRGCRALEERTANMIAPDGTPAALTCSIEPRTHEEITALMGDGSGRPYQARGVHISELLTGTLPEARTHDALLQFALQARICTSDTPTFEMSSALLTDELLTRVLADVDDLDGFLAESAAVPPNGVAPEDIAAGWDPFRVFILPDGRVAMLYDEPIFGMPSTDWREVYGPLISQANIYVWSEDGARLLLDDQWVIMTDYVHPPLLTEPVRINLVIDLIDLINTPRDEQQSLVDPDNALRPMTTDPRCFISDYSIIVRTDNEENGLIAGRLVRSRLQERYPELFLFASVREPIAVPKSDDGQPFVQITFAATFFAGCEVAEEMAPVVTTGAATPTATATMEGATAPLGIDRMPVVRTIEVPEPFRVLTGDTDAEERFSAALTDALDLFDGSPCQVPFIRVTGAAGSLQDAESLAILTRRLLADAFDGQFKRTVFATDVTIGSAATPTVEIAVYVAMGCKPTARIVDPDGQVYWRSGGGAQGGAYVPLNPVPIIIEAPLPPSSEQRLTMLPDAMLDLITTEVLDRIPDTERCVVGLMTINTNTGYPASALAQVTRSSLASARSDLFYLTAWDASNTATITGPLTLRLGLYVYEGCALPDDLLTPSRWELVRANDDALDPTTDSVLRALAPGWIHVTLSFDHQEFWNALADGASGAETRLMNDLADELPFDLDDPTCQVAMFTSNASQGSTTMSRRLAEIVTSKAPSAFAHAIDTSHGVWNEGGYQWLLGLLLYAGCESLPEDYWLVDPVPATWPMARADDAENANEYAYLRPETYTVTAFIDPTLNLGDPAQAEIAVARVRETLGLLSANQSCAVGWMEIAATAPDDLHYPQEAYAYAISVFEALRAHDPDRFALTQGTTMSYPASPAGRVELTLRFYSTCDTSWEYRAV